MAGSIRTSVVTREYEDGWERAFGRRPRPEGAFHHESSEDIEAAVSGDEGDDAPDGLERACGHCGKRLKAGAQCACTARSNRVGYAGLDG